MEMNSFDGGKNENGDMLISNSTLQPTESCDHFSIRHYVAQASERDPEACSPFKSGKPNPGFGFPVFLSRKFRRWDCDNCMSKLAKNQDLDLSSDQSANNNANDNDKKSNNDTSCSISFLGTSLVPLSVHCSGGTVPVPVTEQDSNQENQDNTLLSELTKSDARQLVQEQRSVKAQIESEKSKEIGEIMANTSINNSDLNLNTNQDLNKKSNAKMKIHRQKSRKVRSLAEIIGSDVSVPPHKACRNDDQNIDPMAEKEKEKEKENSVATIACNNSSEIKDQKLNIKSKKKYKTVGVVDETASLMTWLKKTSKKIKKTENKSVKRKNLGGGNTNVSGKEIAAESSEQGRIKEKENERVNVGNIVKKKRTKKPRKCLQLQGGAIIGEISDKKSKKISKKLHHGGIRESTCELNSSKIVQDKGGNQNSKRSGTEVQKVRKKKQKISEQKCSNDLSMDIVELLAKSLQDKHLTNETNLNPNSNSNLSSNSSVMPQIKPGNEKLTSFFPCNKSSFNNYNNSGAGTSKTVQNPQIGQSSNHRTIERNFDLNRVTIEPNRAVPVLNPTFGYSKQQYANNYAYNLPPNLVPVVQVSTRNNDSMPATHLLQLMDASSLTNSYLSPPAPNPNFAPTSQFRPLIAPINVNHHNQQHLMQTYLHRNPCAPFKPLPRFGVLGSLLQQEITSPKQNCGTQSGYRIGDLNLNPPPFNNNNNNNNNNVNYANNIVSNNDGNDKGGCEEGICVINRNPADFTEVDENNEYMRGGEEQNPKFVGGFYGISNGVVYNTENNVGSEREFNNRRFLYNNAAVH